jgi:hypothetical protein
MSEVARMLNNTGSMLPVHFSPDSATKALGTAETEVTVLQGKVDVARRDFDASAANVGRMPSSETGVVTLTQGSQISAKQSDAAVSAPVSLDSKQMTTLSTQVKITDNTFQKAVVIDPSSFGNNSSGSGGKGAEPVAHPALPIAATNLPAPPAITPNDIGIPGAINVNQVFNPLPVNTQGTLRHVHVVIVTGP